MEIRTAKKSEIGEIKQMVDSYEEMDTSSDTFSEKYFKRILKKEVLLVAVEKKEIKGVCFGTYNSKEGWSDLLGLVVISDLRKKGVGSSLVKEFEKLMRKEKVKSINLYADEKQKSLFTELGYTKGRNYISFSKRL